MPVEQILQATLTMKIFAPYRPFVAGIILMLLLLFVEIGFQTPLGTSSYVLVSLLILWFVRLSKMVIPAGIVSSAFLLAMFVYPFFDLSSGTPFIANRLMGLCIVWLAVIFILRFRTLHRAEQKEKDQLKALVEHANEGILLVNTLGNILVANPASEKIFGFESGDLTNRNIDELIPTRFSDSHAAHLGKFIDKPVTRGMGRDLRGIRKNGSEFHVDVSLSHFYDGNEIVIIAFILDATDRVKREELLAANQKMIVDHNQQLEAKVAQRTVELESANQALLKSQAVYHSMARNFPDGFIGVMNRGLQYILVDGKDLDDLGVDPGAVLSDSVFAEIHQTITARPQDELNRAFHGESISFDAEIGGRDYNVSAVPIEGSGQVVNEILVVVKNISPQKKLERELLKTLEKERELNNLKSRFVTMASHEFRTPLTTILSSAFLLENYTGHQLEAEKKKHLDRIKRSVHGLTEILNDFLSLGRLEEGGVQVARNPLNLKRFGEELLQEVSLVKKEDQRIDFEYTGSEEDVSTDKQLLRNILLNLLSNAIKYSPVSSTIRIAITVTSTEMALSVFDQGIGIPPEEQRFLFKRFFRANNASAIQGTGLGLNIVKRYVKLLKGRIDFTSNPGQGTTFTVTLPLEPIAETAKLTPSTL